MKGPTAGLDGMRLTVIKLGSTTHGNEMSRRYVWLDVADHKPASGGGKDVYPSTSSPASTPPGPRATFASYTAHGPWRREPAVREFLHRTRTELGFAA